ncbi:unnamed protein product [Penicillium palitans]
MSTLTPHHVGFTTLIFHLACLLYNSPPSTHEILENLNNVLLNSVHPFEEIPYLTRSLHPTTQSSAETHQPAAMLQTTSCRPLTTLLDSSQVRQEYIL